MDITLTVNKEKVMEEVAQATAYTGAKMQDDDKAHERISTVDEDASELNRFWEESRSDCCQELIGLVANESDDGYSYRLGLKVSESFDPALKPSMEISLHNYFVTSVTAKWYVYTNKKESGEYADKAAALLDDVHRKAVHKKKPSRPTYN